MTYGAPRITDFGRIEVQVFNLTSTPPDGVVTEEAPALGASGPAVSSGADGSAGGALGLIGLAGGVVAVLAGRNNGQEAAAGPTVLTDEERGGQSHRE